MDARTEALLPKEVTEQMVHDQTFRIFHNFGSIIVMAKSDTDKVGSRRRQCAQLDCAVCGDPPR